MNWFVTGIIVVVLLLIVVEDVRHRAVSWPLFPLLAISIVVYTYTKKEAPSLPSYLLYVFINAAFVSLQLLLLKLYFLVKHRANTPLINSRIGLGDLLFLYAIAFYFTPLLFILFYLFTLLVTTATAVVYMLINNHRASQKTVPLAGIQALFLLIFMVINCFVHLDAVNEQWLLNHYPLR